MWKSSSGFKDRRVSTVETSISREEWPATLVKSGVDGRTAKVVHNPMLNWCCTAETEFVLVGNELDLHRKWSHRRQ